MLDRRKALVGLPTSLIYTLLVSTWKSAWSWLQAVSKRSQMIVTCGQPWELPGIRTKLRWSTVSRIPSLQRQAIESLFSPKDGGKNKHRQIQVICLQSLAWTLRNLKINLWVKKTTKGKRSELQLIPDPGPWRPQLRKPEEALGGRCTPSLGAWWVGDGHELEEPAGELVAGGHTLGTGP